MQGCWKLASAGWAPAGLVAATSVCFIAQAIRTQWRRRARVASNQELTSRIIRSGSPPIAKAVSVLRQSRSGARRLQTRGETADPDRRHEPGGRRRDASSAASRCSRAAGCDENGHGFMNDPAYEPGSLSGVPDVARARLDQKKDGLFTP